MRKIWISCFVMAAGIAFGGILPSDEEAILRSVAEQYKLTAHQTHLLLTIRRIEQGRPGLELGVGDGILYHPGRRFAGQFEKSLRLQGEWAAGTIIKRYDGDLTKFAQRYCAANWRVWVKNASHYMTAQDVTRKGNDADTINPRLPDSVMFVERG